MNINGELQANNKNLLETYKSDSIGRNKDIKDFIDILDDIDDNCAIAINGNWGSGKTFFVRQIVNVLNSISGVLKVDESSQYEQVFNKDKESNRNYKKCLAIYYDAWKHDNEGVDPMISLIYSIVGQTNEKFDSATDAIVMGHIRNIIRILDVNDIVSRIKNPNDENILKVLKEREEIDNSIRNYLNSLISERAERLVIFIDELDRCCPTYAIRLLERIKHYFSERYITFVFSTNLLELTHTIKRYYGNDFDASSYLNRFFDFVIDLPEIDRDNFLNYIGENEKIYILDSYKRLLIEEYNLSLREIIKFTRMFNMCVGRKTEYQTGIYAIGEIFFVDAFIVPLLIVLKIKSIETYSNFVGGLDGKPLIKVLNREIFSEIMEKSLANDETFDEEVNIEGIRVIAKTDRIKEIYQSLFTEMEPTIYRVRFGKYVFSRDTQKYIMNVSNLLSRI